jgi:dTDP-4-dehydrorhamnose 3,5-epimerase
MKTHDVIHTNIQDCLLIKPKIYKDNRGRFSEIYKDQIGNILDCKQINYSYSKKGVLRGIHKTPYAKLVTCALGEIFDVCLDLRENSPSYGQYFCAKLNPDSMQQLYIPPNCGHGFYSFNKSIVIYMQEKIYDPNVDETFGYNRYNIPWPEKPTIMSQKDLAACA